MGEPDVLAPEASMERVHALGEEMKGLLGLQDWRIVFIARETEDTGHMAEVEVRHPYHQACVNLGGHFFSDDPSIRRELPWQVSLVHELLHIRLAVHRDHLHKAAYACTDDAQRASLISEIGSNLEEAAVSQASWAIWGLYLRTKTGGRPNAAR